MSKELVLKMLIGLIFEAEFKLFQRQIDDLILKNIEFFPSKEAGFIYLDKWYSASGWTARSNYQLHQSLHPTMHRLVHYRKTVDDDRQIISQILGKLLSACDTTEQVRNEIPECVASLNPSWSTIPRTQDPAQSIQDNPRDVRQYEKVLFKIEAYCAMRLLV